MNGSVATGRRLVATTAVALVLLGVGAGQADAAKKRPNFGSKAQFKIECELLGGTFLVDAFGNTECRFKDGSWIECDANGNDCWYTPPPKREPTDDSPHVPTDGTLDPNGGAADPTGGVGAPGDVQAPTGGVARVAVTKAQDEDARANRADDDRGKERKQGGHRRGHDGKAGRR